MQKILGPSRIIKTSAGGEALADLPDQGQVQGDDRGSELLLQQRRYPDLSRVFGPLRKLSFYEQPRIDEELARRGQSQGVLPFDGVGHHGHGGVFVQDLVDLGMPKRRRRVADRHGVPLLMIGILAAYE